MNMQSVDPTWSEISTDWWRHGCQQLGSLLHFEESLDLVKGEYHPWLCSITAAITIGFAGIIPLLFIPADFYKASTDSDKGSSEQHSRSNGSINILQLLLSFAVGGLLADVFLHLLPEAWTTAISAGATPHEAFTHVGLYTLTGIFVFIIIEMLASHGCQEVTPHNNNNKHSSQDDAYPPDNIDVSGYLNLVANGIDNFTHGLSVAGSFLVSYKTGVLTTIAILIHEVPHEVGDFAILLKSGFTRWQAAKAQIYTAGIGLVGALVTLFIGSTNILNGLHVYILGFTGGGFLNIALVTVLPDLLKEDRPGQSAAQLVALLLGTCTMAVVSQVF